MMHIAEAENEAFSAKFIQYDRPSVATTVCLKLFIKYVNNRLSEVIYNEGEMKGGLYRFKCCGGKVFPIR